MALRIGTLTDRLDYVTHVLLEGSEYSFHFRWNDRAEHWTLDILADDETPLLCGRLIRIGHPLLSQWKHLTRLPPGELIAIDNSKRWDPPGRNELGDRVKLIYLTSEELSAALI